LRVMHGLEWRMPLLIKLDKVHRSCVIDPDLPTKMSACPKQARRWEGKERIKGKEQRLTNAPKFPL
jgi:hypothetical protein